MDYILINGDYLRHTKPLPSYEYDYHMEQLNKMPKEHDCTSAGISNLYFYTDCANGTVQIKISPEKLTTSGKTVLYNYYINQRRVLSVDTINIERVSISFTQIS